MAEGGEGAEMEEVQVAAHGDRASSANSARTVSESSRKPGWRSSVVCRKRRNSDLEAASECAPAEKKMMPDPPAAVSKLQVAFSPISEAEAEAGTNTPSEATTIAELLKCDSLWEGDDLATESFFDELANRDDLADAPTQLPQWAHSEPLESSLHGQEEMQDPVAVFGELGNCPQPQTPHERCDEGCSCM